MTETTLDSIFVRDASIVCSKGSSCAGWASRNGPASRQRRIGRPGRVAKTDSRHASSRPADSKEATSSGWTHGRSWSAADTGRMQTAFAQLRALLGAGGGYRRGPAAALAGQQDVMHLMSLLSPVDHDLAVVYSPLLPVPFREWLLERGMRLVDVPDDEFETMATNVLALAPRRCLMLNGNPRTRAALESAGCEVVDYEGTEISVKGAGGPTCLTRPIERVPRQGTG